MIHQPATDPGRTHRTTTATRLAAALALGAGMGLAAAPAPEACASSTSPNIVLIMADDVGIEAFESYVGNPRNTHDGNNPISTPHLTQLAADGTRFTNAIANPLCTPTRVSLLTGQYNFRNYRSFGYLDNTATTFAQVLQDEGYATHITGKWQLSQPNGVTPSGPAAGNVTPSVMADDYGFDDYALWQLNFTNNNKGSRYWNPKIEVPSADGTTSELLTTTYADYGPDIFTQSVKDHITDSVAASTPFLSYYAMALPHDPFNPTPDQNPITNSQKDSDSRANFDDNIEYIDKLVGQIVDHLDDPNGDGNTADSVRDNTLIIFTSDNGTLPTVTTQTDAGNVTGDKGTASYRGTAVPFIMSWTGSGLGQGVVSDRMVDMSDIFPTLLAAAGAATPAGLPIDGKSIVDVDGNLQNNKDVAYVYYDPMWASFTADEFAQDKQYKLYTDGRLYDIAADPSESNDLSGGTLTQPQIDARDNLQATLDFYALEQLGGGLTINASAFASPSDSGTQTTADDLGDGVNSNLIVGDNGQNNTEFRTVIEFDLTDPTTQTLLDTINHARFEVTVTLTKGTVPDIRLVALTADEDGNVSADDYHAAGDIIETFSGLSEGDVISVDITSILLDDADQNWTAFRLEGVGPLPNGDVDPFKLSADQARFGGAVGSGEGSSTDARLVLSLETPGDTNRDGVVNETDLALLADHWQSLDADWDAGDFNLDGSVDALGLDLMRLNWGVGAGSAPGFAEAVAATNFVPEPAGVTICLGGLGAMMLRRRR